MTWPTGTDTPLRPCASGQCVRKVGGAAPYCCGACADAWEAAHRYEPHAHASGCDTRHAQRSAGQR